MNSLSRSIDYWRGSRPSISVCTLVLLFVLAGCTIHIAPEVNPAAFGAAEAHSTGRIPKTVALVLSPEFVNCTYDYRRGLDPYSFVIGPSLQAYANRIAETHFQSVHVVSPSQASAVNDADLILVPNVKKVELTSFVTASETQNMTIDVEWTLQDRRGNSVLWVSTFSGVSQGQQGTPFSGFAGGKQMITDLVADLWKQTNQGFDKLQKMNIAAR